MSGFRKTKEQAATATPPPMLLRTCHNCHQAKIKCVRRSDTGPCTRCERLMKSCHFTPARRRPNNPIRDSRIESLEAQVQQLLKDRGVHSADTLSCPSPSLPTRPSEPRAGESTSSASLHTTVSTPSADVDVIAKGHVSIETAEILLQRFKSALTPHFPFVVVPSHESLESLQQGKPFLLLTILAAASYDDVALQRSLGRQVQHCIAAKMICGDTISLEALQGLLVHLAWCQYHPRPRRYTQYMQLAIGIIVDMRLDRKPDNRSWKTRIDLTKVTVPDAFLGLDEQRAVAGCYYLCSTVSMLLQKLCTFPWTRHIEDCCKSLDRQQQYTTDKYICHIVEIQHILEEADVTNRNTSNSSTASHLPQLRSRLESIKDTMSFGMMESALLMMQYHSAMVFLCHLNVCTDPALNLLPTGERWPQWRLDALGAGIAAAKSSLSFVLSLPIGSDMNFNNSEWIQLGLDVTYCARFAKLSAQDSIRKQTLHLRRFLDMPGILKDVTSRLRSLSTARMDNDGDRDVFHHYLQRAERLQMWFEAQSDRAQTGPMHANPTQQAVTFDDDGSQHAHTYPSNAQPTWNSSQAAPSQEVPGLSMDNALRVDGSIEFSAGDLFPDDIMDMANFGQFFAFDG